MPVPRRLIVLATSAAVTGLLIYARNRMKDAEERMRTSPKGERSVPTSRSSAAAGSAFGRESEMATSLSGAARELSLFLAGETWHDEDGWKGIWSREAVGSPESWLRGAGRDVLAAERARLTQTPALLAGCKRRWIVVCRYAGLPLEDAVAMWTSTDGITA